MSHAMEAIQEFPRADGDATVAHECGAWKRREIVVDGERFMRGSLLPRREWRLLQALRAIPEAEASTTAPEDCGLCGPDAEAHEVCAACEVVLVALN